MVSENTMKITITVFFLTFLLAFAGLAAADRPVVGTWELISDSPAGDQYTWTLIVTEEQGRLAGKLRGGPPPHEFALIEPNAKGEQFTFRMEIQGETYVVDATVSGATFDGTWKGGNSKGLMKGKKQAAQEK